MVVRSAPDRQRFLDGFELLSKLVECQIAFCDAPTTMTCISTFRKYQSFLKQVQDACAGKASWMMPPAQRAEREHEHCQVVPFSAQAAAASIHAQPEPEICYTGTDGEQNLAPFTDLEYAQAVGDAERQFVKFSQDLSPHKFGAYNDFLASVSFVACKVVIGEADHGYSFLPGQPEIDVSAVLTSSGPNAAQYLTKFTELCSHVITANEEHEAFAFAAMEGLADDHLMRGECFSLALAAAKAQLSIGLVCVQVLEPLAAESAPATRIPQQSCVSILQKARTEYTALESLASLSCAKIKAVLQNLDVGKDGEAETDEQRFNVLLGNMMNNLFANIGTGKKLAEGLQQLLTAVSARVLTSATSKLVSLVPPYKEVVFIPKEQRTQTALQQVHSLGASRMPPINAAREELFTIITSCTAIKNGLNLASTLTAAETHFAESSLFIGTLGLVGYMFLKENPKHAGFQAAVSKVSDKLKMWKFEDKAREAARKEALHGRNISLPPAFQQEATAFLAELAKKRELQM